MPKLAKFLRFFALTVLILWLMFRWIGVPITESRTNRIGGTALQVSPRARDLHRHLKLADLHADSLLFGRDLTSRSSHGHVDLPRLREGGYVLQNFTVVTKVPYGLNIERNSERRLDDIQLLAIAGLWPIRTWSSPLERALYQAKRIRDHSDEGKLKLVLRSGDISERDAYPSLPFALIGLEGAHALEGKVENVAKLDAAGFRTIGLAHFFDNEFAGSAHGEHKGGLTPLGKQLVAELERRRMIVDLAHASPQTIADTLAIATRPMIVSHTGVKGTCNNRRNLSDPELRAIAQRGGLIGIGFWSTAVCGTDAHAIAHAIVYAAKIAGWEHVALGSDFDGAVTVPFDSAHADQLTQALLDEGVTEQQIAAVMGANAFRFFRDNLPQ
jgi:microsomal dipeptidase-like Zn-dependent dipeptidase